MPGLKEAFFALRDILSLLYLLLRPSHYDKATPCLYVTHERMPVPVDWRNPHTKILLLTHNYSTVPVWYPGRVGGTLRRAAAHQCSWDRFHLGRHPGSLNTRPPEADWCLQGESRGNKEREFLCTQGRNFIKINSNWLLRCWLMLAERVWSAKPSWILQQSFCFRSRCTGSKHIL